MYLLILLLPLLSFIGCALWGRNLGHEGVKLFSMSLLSYTFYFSILTWWEISVQHSYTTLKLWTWFDIGVLHATFGLYFDNIVCSMLVLITAISLLVHMYSTSYMEGDPHLPRFMAYLSLFTFFMIVLVTSDNLIQLFIGWEGVGLCSYLLISFWFTRIQATKAGIKAMIINKIGDLGMFLGLIILWSVFGTLEYSSFFPLTFLGLEREVTFTVIAILFLIGVIAKSAQLGLHMWLPDAMEGPTPVSALIHAATMVTAGIFLIIRMSPLFEQAPSVLILIVFLGSLTAFMAATISITQNDLKKVIAYSTCSQLGYMMMICGFSHYNASLFHLVNHGFFKALLFLSAGSIIHSLTDEQDLRKMGSMRWIIPFSYFCIVIGSLSLMGLPFLTGYYSKDLILELLYGAHYLHFSLWLGLLAASMTAFYSFRLIYFTFLERVQGPLVYFKRAHEGSSYLISSLIILLLCSISVGFVLQYTILKDEIPILLLDYDKFLPLYFSLGGALLAIMSSMSLVLWWRWSLFSSGLKIYNFMNHAWYFNTFFNIYIARPVLSWGFKITYKLIDNQLLEVLGPEKITSYLYKSVGQISQLHKGKIALYTFLLILFVSCCVIRF